MAPRPCFWELAHPSQLLQVHPRVTAAPACRPAGAFIGPDNQPLQISEQLPNAHMRLFGGAQYHRAMAEFRAGAYWWRCLLHVYCWGHSLVC